MFINNFDPVAFSFFSMEIRWYSLAYIFGILFGWLILKNILGRDKEQYRNIDDLLTYIILGIIFGGRIGYIIFYNLEYYLNNLFEIFMIWRGGMSFHGGLVGVIIGTYIFAKKNNYNPFIFLDLISLVAPIGIFFGRVANFLNSELYGKETSVAWGVIFSKVDNLSRHPSQLYEAGLEGIILFLVLIILAQNNILKKRVLCQQYFLSYIQFLDFI